MQSPVADLRDSIAELERLKSMRLRPARSAEAEVPGFFVWGAFCTLFSLLFDASTCLGIVVAVAIATKCGKMKGKREKRSFLASNVGERSECDVGMGSRR